MDAIAYHMLAFLGCVLTTDLRAADDMEESEYSDFLGIKVSVFFGTFGCMHTSASWKAVIFHSENGVLIEMFRCWTKYTEKRGKCVAKSLRGVGMISLVF